MTISCASMALKAVMSDAVKNDSRRRWRLPLPTSRFARFGILLGMLLLFFSIALLAVYHIGSADRITLASCRQIQKGMTPDQVQAILGRSPDECATNVTVTLRHFKLAQTWYGPKARVDVYYEENDRVGSCYCCAHDHGESVLDHSLRWLGLDFFEGP